MPTLHIRLIAQTSSIRFAGLTYDRINAIRLTKYSVSSTLPIGTTSVLVQIPWLSQGIHTENIGSGHMILLPTDPTGQYSSEVSDVDLLLLRQNIPTSSEIALFDAGFNDFDIAGGAYEVNLWFDYEPSY